jgi:tetratricopeptide (TPR) repeat protein
MSEVSEANISSRARELFNKGLLAYERNNLPYAMDMFMAVLEMEPYFLKCRRFLRSSAIKFVNETRGGKVSHLVTTLAGLPLLGSGRMALRSGNFIKALSLAEKLLRQDPLNMQFIRLLCDAALKADAPEIAIHTLNVAREYYQRDVALLQILGNLYMQVNLPEEARKCYEAILAIQPHSGEILQALKNAIARETMIKGGWEEASKDGGYRKAIKDAGEAATLEADTRSVRDERSIQLVIRDTESRMKNEPGNLTYRRVLAKLYVQVNRFEDAAHVLEEGRRLSGVADPQLDQALADIRLKQFDFEIAQCRANGDTAGAAAKEKAKKEFYAKSVQTRVERYPNDPQLRFEFGKLLYENGQFNESIQQFQMAQNNPKLKTESHYYLGMCFLHKNQNDLAQEQLEKAAADLTEMNNLKKEIFYELGALLEKSGNFQKAADLYYKEIYQVDIAFKDVAAKIEKAYRKN